MVQISRTSSAFAASAALLLSCSSNDTQCTSDVNGNMVCAGYADASPYDYTYGGTDSGYYPYTVVVYDDPAGYDYAYGTASIGTQDETDAGAADSGRSLRGPDGGAHSPVPELLDKARRGANAINAGIHTTLDPIKDILKTPPTLGNDTVAYGPMDRGPATYRFTMRRFSASSKVYGWKLEAKPVGTETGFALVAGGMIRVGDTPRRGRGVLGADYDAQSGADSSVNAKGKLLLGFADGNTTKILHYVLQGFTPDSTAIPPTDSTAVAWHRDDTANDVRIALQTNLEETATPMPETVVVKVHWRRDAGARADAVATGGDVPPGSRLIVSTCVPATLDRAIASTSAKICPSSFATDCTRLSGPDRLVCPNGFEAADVPQADPTADDPPTGVPEVPDAPAAVSDGTQSL